MTRWRKGGPAEPTTGKHKQITAARCQNSNRRAERAAARGGGGTHTHRAAGLSGQQRDRVKRHLRTDFNTCHTEVIFLALQFVQNKKRCILIAAWTGNWEGGCYTFGDKVWKLTEAECAEISQISVGFLVKKSSLNSNLNRNLDIEEVSMSWFGVFSSVVSCFILKVSPSCVYVIRHFILLTVLSFLIIFLTQYLLNRFLKCNSKYNFS